MEIQLGVTLSRIKKRDYALEVGLVLCQDFYHEHLIEPLENLQQQLLEKFGLHLETYEPSFCFDDYYEKEQIVQIYSDVECKLTHPDKEIDNEYDTDDFSVYDAWDMWYDRKLYVDVVEPVSECDFSMFEKVDWGEIHCAISWDIIQVREDYNLPGTPWFYNHSDYVKFGADTYC